MQITQITLSRLDFIYLNNKVRVRIGVLRPKMQFGGSLEIEVVVDHSDSVEAMKASAVAAAREFLQAASEMTLDTVAIGPIPPDYSPPPQPSVPAATAGAP